MTAGSFVCVVSYLSVSLGPRTVPGAQWTPGCYLLACGIDLRLRTQLFGGQSRPIVVSMGETGEE